MNLAERTELTRVYIFSLVALPLTKNLTPGTVSFHLKKMEKVGLVKCSRNQFYMIYSLNREIIGATIESFIESKEIKDEES